MITARSIRPFAIPVLCALWLPACAGDDGGGTGDDTSSSDESETGSNDTNETETGETGDEGDPNLLEIPGGSFEMGCGASETPCDPDNPPHQVTISAFWMEATEVTVADYQACVDAGGCTEPESLTGCNYGSIPFANHPVNCVTWQQAADYCAWKGRRLPTEAEWEYVATGGTDRSYPWGDAEASCEWAHMYSAVDMMGDFGCMTGTTAAVGSYPDGASPFGALDMAGNVEEWVADWYAADYYTSAPPTDPQGPSDGTERVIRGGNLTDVSPVNLRVFERVRAQPILASDERGFRCAAD